jgi:hypothetical protein
MFFTGRGLRSLVFFYAFFHTLAGGDGMNGVFCGMILLGVIAAAYGGGLSAAQTALLSGGGEAISCTSGV